MTYHIVFVGWLCVRHRLSVGWSGGGVCRSSISGGVGAVDAADAGHGK